MIIRLITAFIILINILILNHEIPFVISGATFGILLLSFFVSNKSLRTFLKIFLLFGCIALLRFEFKPFLVTECAVSFVLLLSSLKFWELETENDHFNMFLILSLTECSLFLLNSTFLIFTIGILKMLFYFYYILKIRNYDISLLSGKRLLILITPSIIFSFVLFYTFPRFTQGFLNANDLQYMISSGDSKMDFSQLGPVNLSKEQVFKVFGLEKSKLPFGILYWKSSVLWQITDEAISAANSGLKTIEKNSLSYNFNYNVQVFQNMKEYMPILDGSAEVTTSALPFNKYFDGSFRLKVISRDDLSYSVSGNYGDRLQNFNPLIERKALKIKSKRIEEIKEQYFETSVLPDDDEKRLGQLKKMFVKKDFQYSTTPPTYSSIEDFLLNGSKGYCTHFALSFAYLARIYNIPSRVVLGYLGGEFNPYDNSVIVRELDGHAWVEVYLKNKGWLRVDPTTLVAPDRITMTASEFLDSREPFFTFLNIKISKDNFNFKSLNNAFLWIDSLNSRLSGSIINFDREKQLQTLRSLTPKNFPVGWIFVTSLLAFLGIFSIIFYFFGLKKLDPNEKRYLKFLKKIKQYGVIKSENETASQFVDRCLIEIPGQKKYLEKELSHYLKSFYK